MVARLCAPMETRSGVPDNSAHFESSFAKEGSLTSDELESPDSRLRRKLHTRFTHQQRGVMVESYSRSRVIQFAHHSVSISWHTVSIACHPRLLRTILTADSDTPSELHNNPVAPILVTHRSCQSRSQHL